MLGQEPLTTVVVSAMLAAVMASVRCSPITAKPRPLALVGLSLAMVLGCAPDELPLPPVVWEGDMVRVRMDDPGIQVCGGTFEALDRHAALVREALLLEGDGVVEYSIADEELVHEICSSRAADRPNACAFPDSGRVYTSVPFVPHEIVHAVRWLDPRLGRLSSPFEEGLATLFGADWPDDIVIPLEAKGLLAERYVTGLREYDRAGQTMSILFDRHGLEAFREFDELARTMSEDAAFAEVFSETKEEFAAMAETMPICEQSQWWMPLLECDGEPITADPETGLLTLTGNVSCGEPDVMGPEWGRMWTSRRFRLDYRTSFFHSYDVEMPEDATLEIVQCTGGCPERVAYIGGRYEIGSVLNPIPSLDPGEYFLRLIRPVSDDVGFFELAIAPP
jgi:hypothetical protein